jgi:Predicted membrane protein (DUF2238)
MNPLRKALVALAALVMLAGMVNALIHRNWEFVYYGVTLIAIAIGIVVLDRKVRLPMIVLVGLFAWLCLHLAGGLIKVPQSAVDQGMTNYTLYNVRLAPWLPRYDQFVHAFGFFVSTLAAWRAIFVGSHRMMKPTFGPLLGAGLIGMGCGGVNEVIEFIATRIMPETNVGGFVNTGWDLVSNMVGCILGMIVAKIMHRAWFAE